MEDPTPITQRRTKGSGGVSRRPDGRWAATINREVNGERKRRVFYGRTATEAEAKMRAAFPDLPEDTGTFANPRSLVLAAARALGSHTRAEWFAKVRACERRCHYCGDIAPPGRLTKDHRIPISRGGSDSIDNIVPCCATCNGDKSNMTDAEYFALIGRQQEWKP